MAYCILKSYKLKTSPLAVFEALKGERNCFFLDSSLNSNYRLGRYSFLGIDPFYILESKNSQTLTKLREVLEKYKINLTADKIPFLGGAVGYLSYDAEWLFGFYNTAIVLDHFKKLLYIFSVGFPEKKYNLAKSLAEKNYKRMYRLLSGIGVYQGEAALKARPSKIKSNFTKPEYISAVKKAKEYIRRGDIYQINLSQRFQAKTNLSGAQIYKRLRSLSPSYFSAYFDTGNSQILSSSPERFLSLEGGLAVTRPMKGTRPRGENKKQDSSLEKELLKSAKDKAELMMIVDLERNDLGRVCKYSSIKVESLRVLEKYSTVFQTTANILGRLHKDKDRLDLLRACFPGGSITGCPKIRAMQIIEELEPDRRGIYTGSLGYLSFTGDMDFNILIRTILKKGNQIHFGVGGGIVADSEPEKEYQETLVKARALIEAVQ